MWRGGLGLAYLFPALSLVVSIILCKRLAFDLALETFRSRRGCANVGSVFCFPHLHSLIAFRQRHCWGKRASHSNAKRLRASFQPCTAFHFLARFLSARYI